MGVKTVLPGFPVFDDEYNFVRYKYEFKACCSVKAF